MHHNIEIAAGVMGQPKPCPFGSGLRKFALEFVVKKNTSGCTGFVFGLILYSNFLQKYKIKPNLSKLNIRPPLVDFFKIAKKSTNTRSSANF